jgi:glutathione S-transferase
MITLYHSPQSRSGSIVWLLEELEVPYQTRNVGFRKADGTGARDPSNPHPHGKVPALTDDGETVFESSAIALFLTDKYRTKNLGPAAGEPKRGEYLTWLAYRPGVMEPAILSRRFEIKHVFGAMGWDPPMRWRKCSTSTWHRARTFWATTFRRWIFCWGAACAF